MKSVQRKRPDRNANHLRILAAASRAPPGPSWPLRGSAIGAFPMGGGFAAGIGKPFEGPTCKKINNCHSAHPECLLW